AFRPEALAAEAGSADRRWESAPAVKAPVARQTSREWDPARDLPLGWRSQRYLEFSAEKSGNRWYGDAAPGCAVALRHAVRYADNKAVGAPRSPRFAKVSKTVESGQWPRRRRSAWQWKSAGPADALSFPGRAAGDLLQPGTLATSPVLDAKSRS